MTVLSEGLRMDSVGAARAVDGSAGALSDRGTGGPADLDAAVAVHRAGAGGIVWVGEPGSGAGEALAGAVAALVAHGAAVLPLSARVRSASEVVVLAGDLDLLSAPERIELLRGAAAGEPGVVLLAVTRTPPPIAGHRLEIRRPPSLDAAGVLRVLDEEHGITVAPCVAAVLARDLAGNRGAIAETARLLGREQALGRAALPNPLPSTPLVAAVLDDDVTVLDDDERRLLLIAVVAVVDRIDVVCAAGGIGLERMIRGRLARNVEIVAGRYRLTDARLRAHVHDAASPSDRTEAHERLAAAHAAASEPDLAEWHASLAHRSGGRRTPERLIALARRALDRGDAVWAHEVARQAAAQARGQRRRTAERLAGAAALESGFVADALDRLGRPLRDRHDDDRSASAALVAAAALVSGDVPHAELERARTQRSRRGEESRQAAELHAVAAVLAAERGHPDGAQELLATARAQAGPAVDRVLDAAAGWCSGFGVDRGEQPARAPRTGGSVGPASRALEPYELVGRAISHAARAEWAAAAEVLRGALLHLTPAGHDGERAVTPLAEAHLRVAAALVDIAAGRLATALEDLERAALRVPIALPFAGLGVAALQRLSLVVRGAASPLHRSLVASGGAGVEAVVRREAVVDESLLASADGDTESAALLMRLANGELAERPPTAFALPTPDEAQLWLAAGRPEEAERCLAEGRERTPQAEPALLRGRLALAAVHGLDDLAAETAGLASRTPSVYERARLELELSTALARADDDRARLHLLAARHLFARAGAPMPSAPPVVPRARLGSDLGTAWTAQLTDREADVARRVVAGESNREVARALHLSVRTVETHLGRVFGKLGVRSRTQLAHVVHAGVHAHARTFPSGT